jgi:hypothetical protein
MSSATSQFMNHSKAAMSWIANTPGSDIRGSSLNGMTPLTHNSIPSSVSNSEPIGVNYLSAVDNMSPPRSPKRMNSIESNGHSCCTTTPAQSSGYSVSSNGAFGATSVDESILPRDEPTSSLYSFSSDSGSKADSGLECSTEETLTNVQSYQSLTNSQSQFMPNIDGLPRHSFNHSTLAHRTSVSSLGTNTF